MSEDSKLGHALKMKFGLAPGEPTNTQLAAIKGNISKITATGRPATEAEWAKATATYCPGFGKYKYAGIDNSDLNALLALAIQAAKGS
jgi:hypothetical protein